jgi:dTDP-4-amino-4,6-dideoxygalactose transaminase
VKNTEFCGLDEFTTKESERLLRLPLWYGISNQQQETVVKMIYTFFETIISADE